MNLDAGVALGGLSPSSDGTYDIGGTPIALPVGVRSARMANATYLVDADAAQSVIAATGLTVDRKRRNRAVVSLALVTYLDGDLQSYDEIGLAVVIAAPEGSPQLRRGGVSTYIHRLPVSEPFTCMAGRGIWGFPKWVAPMAVDIGEQRATAWLDNGSGERVIDISIRRGPLRVPGRPMTMACYSNDESGAILRTEWSTRNRGVRLRFGGGSADVTIGTGHPFADELRSMGFPRKPLLTMYTEHMQATFGPPVRI